MIVQLMQEVAGGTLESVITDECSMSLDNTFVDLSSEKLLKYAGQEIASKELQEMKSLKKVFIFGKDKELIFNTLRQYAHCLIVQDLKEALKEAVKFSKDDDCVLFSPACSSLDMFKDYKDRGETFKRLIKDLNYE